MDRLFTDGIKTRVWNTPKKKVFTGKMPTAYSPVSAVCVLRYMNLKFCSTEPHVTNECTVYRIKGKQHSKWVQHIKIFPFLKLISFIMHLMAPFLGIKLQMTEIQNIQEPSSEPHEFRPGSQKHILVKIHCNAFYSPVFCSFSQAASAL
jgi:hypothetical protein